LTILLGMWGSKSQEITEWKFLPCPFFLVFTVFPAQPVHTDTAEGSQNKLI
jgi:hypothetical protein